MPNDQNNSNQSKPVQPPSKPSQPMKPLTESNNPIQKPIQSASKAMTSKQYIIDSPPQKSPKKKD